MSINSLIYTLEDTNLLETKIFNKSKNKTNISIELFLITHSENIIWSQKQIKRAPNITDILLNISYFTYF